MPIYLNYLRHKVNEHFWIKKLIKNSKHYYERNKTHGGYSIYPSDGFNYKILSAASEHFNLCLKHSGLTTFSPALEDSFQRRPKPTEF